MVGFWVSLFVFNVLAFFFHHRLSNVQILCVWLFTVSFQTITDVFLDFHYQAYWYFTKEVEWLTLPNVLFLVPPVNIIFLHFFPFGEGKKKQLVYLFGFTVTILLYELFTLLPQPLGYFHYGWWEFYYSALLDPFLLLSVVGFYKFVLFLEKRWT